MLYMNGIYEGVLFLIWLWLIQLPHPMGDPMDWPQDYY
jgi:hypothetical protein